MQTEGGSVDASVHVNVQALLVGFERVAIAVELEIKVVCGWCDASVGKHGVDAAKLVQACFEQGHEVCP